MNLQWTVVRFRLLEGGSIIYQHLDDRAKTRRTKQREPRSELVTAQRLGSVPDAIKARYNTGDEGTRPRGTTFP